MCGDCYYVLGLAFVSLATVLHGVNLNVCRVGLLVCLHHSELECREVQTCNSAINESKTARSNQKI